jgi:hypothetical protein
MILSGYSTTNGRHDIAEILLKVALNTVNQIKSNKLDFTFNDRVIVEKVS